jgi:hypothetical protein
MRHPDDVIPYKLTKTEIEIICKTLKDNHLCINETYECLKSYNIHVTKTHLRRIRRKVVHKEISDKYF